MNIKLQDDYTPVALYARVSSDRQDVDLSVSAQFRAFRDYAQRNGYLVAREYVDEAESGRLNRLLRAAQIFPHRRDPTGRKRKVSAKRRFAGSIHNGSAPNHNIMHPFSSF